MVGKERQIQHGERWPKYKEQYLRTFQRMVDRGRAEGRLKADWKTGEDVWDWWTRAPEPEPDDDKTMSLFE
jgi:hypothetical protein